MSSVVVSSELQFANKKIQSTPNSKVLVSIAPHNGSVFPILNADSTSEFAIPTGQAGSFHSTQNHSYIAGNLRAVSGATAHSSLSCQSGAHDLLKEIRIFHGAQKIDEVLHYGKVVCLLRDLQASSDHSDIAQWVQKGDRRARAFGAGTANATKYWEFIIPLVGLLSPQTQKALPLQDMGNDSLRLYTTWHEYSKWAGSVAEAPTTLDITNLRYVYEQLQFSPEVSNSIRAETGGVYQINSIGIDCNEYTLQSGQTSDHRLIPISYSQVKSLMFGYYDGNNEFRDRVKPFAANSDLTAAGDYHVSIGGVAYPQQSVSVSDSANQCRMELMKAVQPLSFSENNLLGDFGKTADGVNSTFAVGIDLQGYASVNEKMMMQGVNTYSTDILFHQRFGAGLGGAYKLFYVALFEKVIQVANRQTTVVF